MEEVEEAVECGDDTSVESSSDDISNSVRSAIRWARFSCCSCWRAAPGRETTLDCKEWPWS